MWEKIGAIALPILVRLLDLLLTKSGEKDVQETWLAIQEGKGAARALDLIARAQRVRDEAKRNPGRTDPYLRP